MEDLLLRLVSDGPIAAVMALFLYRLDGTIRELVDQVKAGRDELRQVIRDREAHV